MWPHQPLTPLTSEALVITGNEEGDFTTILLKKGRAKFKNQEIVTFANTKKVRKLPCVKVSVDGNEFRLTTSHLGSTRDHSVERISQLKTFFQKMQEAWVPLLFHLQETQI